MLVNAIPIPDYRLDFFLYRFPRVNVAREAQSVTKLKPGESELYNLVHLRLDQTRMKNPDLSEEIGVLMFLL